MKRRSFIKGLFSLGIFGSLKLKAEAEAEIASLSLGPDMGVSGFSLRFSDGCIDQDNIDIISYCKSYSKFNELDGKSSGIVVQSLEFQKKAEPMDVLGHEEECPHTHKPHYHNTGNIEKTYLYKNGKLFDKNPWKICSVSYSGDSYTRDTVWLRYNYESIMEDQR